MTVPAYLLFHLNLAFSSVSAEKRPEIIAKCYWPMLNLAKDHHLPIGIELTGWTLSEIARIDPEWVETLRSLLAEKQCELIGSGWSQLIGPLVPYPVNRWNQSLGLQAYLDLLGVKPSLVLVNEMAYSDSMVDVYHEAGYQGFVMDRDNVRLALNIEDQPLSAVPTHGLGPGGAKLPVLWGDSNLFQQLQRVVHSDKPLEDYVEYVSRRAQRDQQVLPLYCNDAEVFDFRPGRFHTEGSIVPEGEWHRLVGALQAAEKSANLEWVLPSKALEVSLAQRSQQATSLTSIAYPVPVKKQAKYNVNRWSVTGRDDLQINTHCHALFQKLEQSKSAGSEQWRALCELWSSDLRTHITPERWQEAQRRIASMQDELSQVPMAKSTPSQSSSKLHEFGPPEWKLEKEASGLYLNLESELLHLRLNLRRGMAIDKLAFASHSFISTFGSLAQGYFDSISLGADFYSGGAILEVPATHQRHTDLVHVDPDISQSGFQVKISAQLPFGSGRLIKTLIMDSRQEELTLDYEFQDVDCSVSSLRVGLLTFFNHALQLPLTLASYQGGPHPEAYVLDRAAAHASPASTLVSSSCGLSATTGEIDVLDAQATKLLALRWDPSQAAVMPLVTHQLSSPVPFSRIKFSLSEFDDTSKPAKARLNQSFTLRISSAARSSH